MTVADVARQLEAVGGDSDPTPDQGEPDQGRGIEVDVGGIETDGPAEADLGARLRAPLEGSIHDRTRREIWDPENGAENRVILVVEELGGLDGIPRAGHLVIGFAEMLVKHSEPDQGEPDQGEPDQGEPDQGEPDQGEPDSDTERVLNYDPE